MCWGVARGEVTCGERCRVRYGEVCWGVGGGEGICGGV